MPDFPLSVTFLLESESDCGLVKCIAQKFNDSVSTMYIT